MSRELDELRRELLDLRVMVKQRDDFIKKLIDDQYDASADINQRLLVLAKHLNLEFNRVDEWQIEEKKQ